MSHKFRLVNGTYRVIFYLYFWEDDCRVIALKDAPGGLDRVVVRLLRRLRTTVGWVRALGVQLLLSAVEHRLVHLMARHSAVETMAAFTIL